MRDDGITLALAGLFAVSVALFQAMIALSPERSLYFGAPETLMSQPVVLTIAGLAAALVLAVFGLYGLSGAGLVPRLPWLRPGLLTIGVIFTLRGVIVIPPALATAFGFEPRIVLSDATWSTSVVALSLGLLYLAGTIIGWKRLGSRTIWRERGGSRRPSPAARATAM